MEEPASESPQSAPADGASEALTLLVVPVKVTPGGQHYIEWTPEAWERLQSQRDPNFAALARALGSGQAVLPQDIRAALARIRIELQVAPPAPPPVPLVSPPTLRMIDGARPAVPAPAASAPSAPQAPAAAEGSPAVTTGGKRQLQLTKEQVKALLRRVPLPLLARVLVERINAEDETGSIQELLIEQISPTRMLDYLGQHLSDLFGEDGVIPEGSMAITVSPDSMYAAVMIPPEMVGQPVDSDPITLAQTTQGVKPQDLGRAIAALMRKATLGQEQVLQGALDQLEE